MKQDIIDNMITNEHFMVGSNSYENLKISRNFIGKSKIYSQGNKM